MANNNKGRQFLSDLKLYSDYLKWDDDLKRYESWEEACDKVLETHYMKYGEDVIPYLDEFRESYHNKEVLASQRNLQFRGEQIMKHNAKLYNCFHEDEKFVTTRGVKSFKNFSDGDRTIVLTHNGNWKPAKIKSYGKQKLFNITFGKSWNETTVKVTRDHRWILKDGAETTNLQIGDNIKKPKNIFGEFDYNTASPFEKLYWCYGMVYGDGTRVKDNGEYKYSMIRLCRNDAEYESRFKEMGFKTSSNLSLNGDVMAYTGKYQKTTPNPDEDSPELIRAFVAGYLCADGEKNRNQSGKKYLSIQSSEKDHIEFIRRCFPIAGVSIISETDLTGQKTNFGTRGKTISFRISDTMGSKYNAGWKVKSIEEAEEDVVWCLEVEDDKSFVMPNGIVTGNCSTAYAYSPDVFNKGFYVLLCGTGLGVNLKRKYVSQLPDLHRRKKDTKLHVVEDSIEGWAEASKVLISSYAKHPSLYEEFFGYNIKFDYSQIRPKGALITGGFKAPGHEGLKQSLERIEKLLNDYLSDDTPRPFKSIIAYDIFMHLSDAVLSGGVRRSAMNIIMDLDDDELVNAKTGNWREDNPQRARSNNSVGLIKGDFSKELFTELVNKNEGDNDLGFVFMNHEDEMFNPCVSGDSLINTPNGLYFPESLEDNNKITLNGIDVDAKPFHQTGIQPTIKFKTNSGREIKVTPNHLMLLGLEQEFVTADTLEVGDTLSVSNNFNRKIETDSNSSDYKKGYLLGSFLGDGNYCNDSCQIKFWGENNSIYHNNCKEFIDDLDWAFGAGANHNTFEEDTERYTSLNCKALYNFIEEKDSSVIDNKRLTKKLLEGSFDYISGIIAGYFDADGTVLPNKEKGNSVRILSSQLENLETLQIGLNALGIYSKIYNDRNKSSNGVSILPDGNGGEKEFEVKDSHELVITKESMKKFFERVHIMNTDKWNKIKGILESYKRDFYKTSFVEEIVSVENCKPEPVFDCEVDMGIESFECNGFIVHNCFEISFNFYNQIKDYNEAVFQFCNLCEINASACTFKTTDNFSEDKFFELCRKASIIGTLQAGYTDFPYLGQQTNDIVAGEALLGVSITGWMMMPDLFDEELLRKGAEIVKDTNAEVAEIIGINTSARSTTVKPSGNASVVLQTESGIHPAHSKRGFRLMQLNKDSETAEYLVNNYPEVLEESKWSATNTDWIVYATYENPEGTMIKDDMQGVKHLELIRLVQNSWVAGGKRPERCYEEGTDHNVSNTVIMDDKEEIIDYLYEAQDDFTAVSFISEFGDKDYPQSPFTSVLNTDELIEKYGDGVVFMSGLIVDGLHYFHGDLWEATEHVKNPDKKLDGTREQTLLKKDWIRRVKKYAKNYFKKDLEQTIYCMKDVHLWHKYNTVNRIFRPIDFQDILTKPDYEDIDKYGSLACSGGKCSIEDWALGQIEEQEKNQK